jgi:hypothetical protein
MIYAFLLQELRIKANPNEEEDTGQQGAKLRRLEEKQRSLLKGERAKRVPVEDWEKGDQGSPGQPAWS